MSKRQVIESTSDKVLRVLGTFSKKARKDPAWIERLEIMLEGRNPFEQNKGFVKNWLQPIIDLERQCHRDFFGTVFSLAEFTRTLKKYGAEKVELWKNLGLEPHFLPAISLSQDSKLPGWKVKSENWFWGKIHESKIFRIIHGQWMQDQRAGDLESITILVDTRLKPKYGDMYENDWLSDIIVKVRVTGKIQDFNPQSSRFNVSVEETELIKVEAMKILGINSEQIRLEREIEANVISQMYLHMPRVNDGTTNTWEWREEFFGGHDCRLSGGDSDYGGLAHVRYRSVSGRFGHGAFRFLVVL